MRRTLQWLSFRVLSEGTNVLAHEKSVLGPERVGQRGRLPHSRGRRCRRPMSCERFPTMRTLQVVLPHSVDHSQCNKRKCENQASEECGVRVENEDEVMHVNHLLSVPHHRDGFAWRVAWDD